MGQVNVTRRSENEMPKWSYRKGLTERGDKVKSKII